MGSLTRKMRLLSIGAAAGLTLGLVGTAAAITSTSPPAPYKACSSAKSVLSVEVNGQCPAGSVLVTVGAKGSAGPSGKSGPTGKPGVAGAQGPQGAAGANGANGASVETSVGVPSDFCTNDNTDIDLSDGEVYTCTAN
jgi:hypothetical protein